MLQTQTPNAEPQRPPAIQSHRILSDPVFAQDFPSVLSVLERPGRDGGTGSGTSSSASAGAAGRVRDDKRGLRGHKLMLIDDVSFGYGVGGWGLSHAVVGQGMGSKVEGVLAGLSGSLAHLPAQALMLAALSSPHAPAELAANVNRYVRVRQGVLNLLCKVPRVRGVGGEGGMGGKGVGGLHVAIDVSDLGISAQEVADVLLEEVEVCVVAVSHGEQELIRVSITGEEGQLKEAVRRLAACLAGLVRDLTGD
jgi:hypothetical protein